MRAERNVADVRTDIRRLLLSCNQK